MHNDAPTRTMAADHQRREKRGRVFLTVLLHGPFGSVDLRLTDLSPHGACGSCPHPLPPGTEVELVRGDVSVPARVIWAADGKIGVEFSAAVDEGVFRAQNRGAAAAQVTFRPVEKSSRRLERHWLDILSR